MILLLNLCQVKRMRKAFTLVELLVVISIIALLLSIMMPALSAARKQAQSVICKTNLKTIGQAEMLYAANNNDKLAPTRLDRPGNYGFYWAAQLWAGFYGATIPKQTDYFTRPPIVKPDWLSCPSQKKLGKGYTWSDLRFEVPPLYPCWLQNICYARNTTGQGWIQSGTPPKESARLTNIKRASDVVASADGFFIYFDGGNNIRTTTDLYDGKNLRAKDPYTNYQEKMKLQVEYRHGKGNALNLLLWDGHVSSVTNSIADTYKLDPTSSSSSR